MLPLPRGDWGGEGAIFFVVEQICAQVLLSNTDISLFCVGDIKGSATILKKKSGTLKKPACEPRHVSPSVACSTEKN